MAGVQPGVAVALAHGVNTFPRRRVLDLEMLETILSIFLGGKMRVVPFNLSGEYVVPGEGGVGIDVL